MLSTKEPQWIEVNNHALDYFGGVPALVVCDNCKQAVIVNQDWIEPELNKDYADWADHYGTVILHTFSYSDSKETRVSCFYVSP